MVTWISMPTFEEDALQLLEERRRLLLRRRSMERVGGSKAIERVEDATHL